MKDNKNKTGVKTKNILALQNFFQDIKRVENLIFVVILTAIAIMVRTALFPKLSGDFNSFLIKWYNQIKANGGFAAVGMDIGDYTPAYYYILAFLTYIPIKAVNGIKLVSCIADLVTAIFGYKIVKEATGNKNKGLMAYGVLLFMPSVIINSGAWAQCDAIFSMFIVMSIYFLLKDRDWACAICFSISFAFKIQAVFFAPVLLIMLLRKKMRFRTVLALPIVYIISIIPACIAGGNFFKLLTVYTRQSGQYKNLDMYLPNIWSPLVGNKDELLGKAGIYLAGGLVLIAIYFVYRANVELNKKNILAISGLFTLLVPYVLPHMHERYYFLPAVVALLFVMTNAKRVWMFLVMELASVTCEIHFLYGANGLDINLQMILVTLALVWYFKEIYDNRVLEEE